MLGKCFFMTESHNPDYPTEEWTLLTEYGVGSYSESLSWGKYKIVISGGGGSGGASSATHSDYRNWANDGTAGEEITTYVNVFNNTIKTISGIVGDGGKASYAYAQFTGGGIPTYGTATAGNAGVGYANGTKGTAKTGKGQGVQDASAVAGGSGGGSTSLEIDGVFNNVAKGGNGGDASADEIKSVSGGIGGSGGTATGTGASGGTGVFGYKSAATSGGGTAGYVKVYISNLKPEPL